MSRTIAIIAARMGSSRLPGKTLKPILGKPMLERMIERVRRSRRIDEICLATSTNQVDDVLPPLAKAWGIECFRGSPDDVLDRVYRAAKSRSADIVVELLGDNPLVHSALIDDVVDLFRERKHDYAATATTEYPHVPAGMPLFPVGIRVQAMTMSTLEWCAREAVGDYFRENSTTYIYGNPSKFDLGYFPAQGAWADLAAGDLTFAVNYPHNFDLVDRIFQALHPEDPDFDLHAVLRHFRARPELRILMTQGPLPGGSMHA